MQVREHLWIIYLWKLTSIRRYNTTIVERLFFKMKDVVSNDYQVLRQQTPPLCTPQQTTERQNFTVLERQNEKEITENSQSRKLSFWCICFKPIYLSIKEYFCFEVLQKMLKKITSKRENAKLTTLRGLLSLLRYVQCKSNWFE